MIERAKHSIAKFLSATMMIVATAGSSQAISPNSTVDSQHPGTNARAGVLNNTNISVSALRVQLKSAWDDAHNTWRRLIGERRFDLHPPQIAFVDAIRPSHCYGLYIGNGPVYCSANGTVFVSLQQMKELAAQVGRRRGLGILVAHEIGHHIQRLTGRFRLLAFHVRSYPALRTTLSRYFELEADCLAGVWAKQSKGYAASERTRHELRGALLDIGDEKIQQATTGSINTFAFTHGTSKERLDWFRKGFDSGDLATCNILERALD